MRRADYRRTAYPSAWLAAICGLGYSISFVFVSRSDATLGAGLSGFFLIAGGLLSLTALLGVYDVLRDSGGTYNLWALLIGAGGALAAVLHGGYDLANAIHVPDQTSALPSQVDPRGLGTFGLAGVSLLGFAYLMSRENAFPRGLVLLGYLSGALLVLVYLGRLVILDANSLLILIPAGLEGFIVNPVWYAWLGFALRRQVTQTAG